MKRIVFANVNVTGPEWVNWMAFQRNDGTVVGFEHRPSFADGQFTDTGGRSHDFGKGYYRFNTLPKEEQYLLIYLDWEKKNEELAISFQQKGFERQSRGSQVFSFYNYEDEVGITLDKNDFVTATVNAYYKSNANYEIEIDIDAEGKAPDWNWELALDRAIKQAVDLQKEIEEGLVKRRSELGDLHSRYCQNVKV